MNFSSGSYSYEVDLQMQFCFESVRGSCKRTVRPLRVQVFIFLFLCLAILVTIFGNLLIITAIAHFKQLQTTTNYLILSLAVCDFLLGTFVMPCSAVRSVQGCWFLGDFLCKIHSSTDIMLSTCSIFHISFISIDRYIAICTPLLYQSINNLLTICLMVTTSWLISAVFAYGMIFSGLNLKGSEVFYETQVQCIGGCTLFFTETSSIVASMIIFFIPGLIIVGLYIKIYKVARRQARLIKDQGHRIPMDNENRCRHSGKSERRKENSLAVVVGVFLICWTPNFFCTITDTFTGFTMPPMLFDVLFWFGYMNSSFNPLLYAFFYSWFRRAFRIILSGRVFQKDSCRMKLYTD